MNSPPPPLEPLSLTPPRAESFSLASSHRISLASSFTSEPPLTPFLETPQSLPLHSIFYAEFDNQKGPSLVFQHPPQVLNQKSFEAMAGYILLHRDLKDTTCTFTLDASPSLDTTRKCKIVSAPVFVFDKQYARNSFNFAFGMVIVARADGIIDVGPFDPILRKIANSFKRLEETYAYLSHKQEGMTSLEQVLPRILEDLNVRGACNVPIRINPTYTSQLALKVFPKLLDAAPVLDFQVPVLIKDLAELVNKDWDLTIQQLLPHIDGSKFVKRIAEEAGVNTELACRAFAQLSHFHCLSMVDIFQYSNLYACTHRMTLLVDQDEMQAKCVYFAALPNRHPSFRVVYGLLASLHPNAPFGHFCAQFASAKNGIHDEKLITFALMHGLVRRLHRVPVYDAVKTPLKSPSSSMVHKVLSLADGTRCVDEICATLMISAREMLDICENNADTHILLR